MRPLTDTETQTLLAKLANYTGNVFEIAGGLLGLERQLRGAIDPAVILSIITHFATGIEAFNDVEDKTRYHVERFSIRVPDPPQGEAPAGAAPADQGGEPSN